MLSASSTSMPGSQSRIDVRVCSVISNWTGRPVFLWITAVRSRTWPPTQMSLTCSPYKVTAPQVAVDGEIEQGEVALTMLQLKPDTDRRYVFRFQRAFLRGQSSLVPRIAAPR